ncbi:hypothetical protein FEI17_09415 [Kosakonia radicincitans]|uniref:hypothetical protein n=1 Tax=Kosakonia radicincitans TaxID=283686 RepID=UPI0011EC25FB|nr:hypothetical protein [Kosakonia radicincitans]QEM90850.1 hypothetical protein FEI17_09415 [Kosakonia radicincitans]
MKKLVKSLLDRFQLSHIRWMIIGVLLTELITWLLYKDPKKITAPGLSALVAVCALCLAIYSAYQVKKWVNGKVNEKGFKKCEAVIDKTQEIALVMLKVNPEIEKLFRMNLILLDIEKYNLVIENLKDSIEQLRLLTLEIHTHEMHLNIWGFEVAENYRLLELTEAIGKYNKAIRSSIENSVNFTKKGEYKEAEDDKAGYQDAVKLVGAYMDKLNNSTFDNIFVEHKK